jgi:hypothetical protein
MVDLLLGLAWVVIVLTPALLASCQPVVANDGYLNVNSEGSMQPQPASSHTRKR